MDTESDVEAERVLSRLRDGQRPIYGDANEVKQRKTILERLETLERHIGIATTAPPEMGHNHPPEPIDDDVARQAYRDISNASDAISTEIAKRSPRLDEVASKTSVLSKVSKGFRATAKEAVEFVKRVKDKARDKAVEIVIGSIVTGGTVLHQDVGHALTAALDSIMTWLRMIF